MEKEQRKKIINSNILREFLLITLYHVQNKRELTKEEVVQRISKAFECISIVVAKEEKKKKEFHYHIGVRNKSASRYTAKKIVHKTFPELK